MNRTATVVKNAIWEFGYYLIVIALGFLAPRYIILIYGSEVNGLSSTITQILNIILILQAGATTAAIFSLYKPIADNDVHQISKNIYSAEKFFKRISFIFAGIMLITAFFTAIFIKSKLNSKYIFIAFAIMGLKSFLDLYFTSKFRIVFTAFQEKFIISIATLIEQVVYYSLVFLSIHLRMHFVFIYVWFFAGCVIKVLYLEYKYKKRYGEMIPQYKGEDPGQIKGRSYAFANEIAHSIVSSSVAIVLSFMYGLFETSVYAVYSYVGQALTLIVTALYSAFAPSFGNLVAAENKENAKKVFGIFQFLYVMLNSVMMYCMTVLIVPFARIYTSGATDINYINMLLACVMGLSGICSAYRIPYNVVVSSCGYFQETWKQPVICVFVSLLVSCIGGKYDYSLILLGPIVFYLINFIYQHFRIRSLAPHLISSSVFLMFSISIVGFLISAVVCYTFPLAEGITSWLIYAVISLIASVVYVFIVTHIFLPKESGEAIGFIKTRFIGRKTNA